MVRDDRSKMLYKSPLLCALIIKLNRICRSRTFHIGNKAATSLTLKKHALLATGCFQSQATFAIRTTRRHVAQQV